MRPTDQQPVVLRSPLTTEVARSLHVGDRVLISGEVYTARDAAHRRLVDLLEAGKPLPIELEGAIIYYCGPTPAPPGRPIGSAGPTTSSRMDAYAPLLHAHGVRATIGKGPRGAAVRVALQEHGAVYLAAVGGAGALLAECIVAAEVVAFEDLGTEAIRKLTVEDFPAIVAYDAHGAGAFAGNQ
jgi:fumarate hydratase subunit beta